MNRRKFVQSSTLGAALPLASFASTEEGEQEGKELFELREYEMTFGRNQNQLVDYLQNAFRTLLQKNGCKVMLFDELGKSDPRKIYALISYPSAASYIQVQQLLNAEEFMQSTAEYAQIPHDQAIYNRNSSSLLLAFDGLPMMLAPVDGATIFELRTYEGYSEDAVRRKIKMFNEEEIDLFKKLDLRPIFFGEMIAGPYRPSLVYMINFKDMEERNANWQTFAEHPEWRTMVSKEEYAYSVSNIRKTFLTPLT